MQYEQSRLKADVGDSRFRARSRLPALLKRCSLFILGAAATPSIFTRRLGFGRTPGRTAELTDLLRLST